MFTIRRTADLRAFSLHHLDSIASHGLLHYRGCRAGQRKQRSIQVIQGFGNQRRPIQLVRPLCSNINIKRFPLPNNAKSHSANLHPIGLSSPSLYVLNASSLAKPHAVQQLESDLVSYAIDVAVITESHFKKKHDDALLNIKDYSLIRRDREGRRGGGVAAYVRK